MVSAGSPVTELQGIGSKTAETLDGMGIRTVGDLASEYKERGGSRLPNARVIGAARRAATEMGIERGGSFTDPETGLRVTEENRTAVEKLGFKEIGDLGSIDTRKEGKRVAAVEGSDTLLGELVEPARSGDLGRQGAGQSLIGWASDAAGNLTDDSLGSAGLQDLNRAGKRESETVTTSPDQGRQSFSVGDYARAAAYDQRRSERAQQVDDREKAPTTTDYEEWRADPRRHDFPGVDTPKSADTLFGDYRKSKRHGFGSSMRSNRDKEKLRRGVKALADIPGEAAERLTGDRRAFDVDTDRIF